MKGLLSSLHSSYDTNRTGQYVSDALKYSQIFPAITARSLGMVVHLPHSAAIMPQCTTTRGLDFTASRNSGQSHLKLFQTDAKYLGRMSDDYRYQLTWGAWPMWNFQQQKDKGL